MLRHLIKTMRLRQWTKNAFVFAALIFDGQLFSAEPFIRTLEGTVLFCLLSSCVYILNDIKDVKQDRLHPVKKNRPIASGKLPIPTASAALGILLVIIFPLAYLLDPVFCALLAGYFVMNMAYSFWLKHIPMLDVMIIAAGFVLRVAAGVSLITVERFSPWLYVVTTLLALYIGFGKRRAELSLMNIGANSTRKVLDGYTIPFLDQLITIVSSTTVIAYSLYTFLAPKVAENHYMMLTIPFVMYGIFRYLYLIQVKNEGGAPEELVLTDRPLQMSILLCGVMVLLVLYVFAR